MKVIHGAQKWEHYSAVPRIKSQLIKKKKKKMKNSMGFQNNDFCCKMWLNPKSFWGLCPWTFPFLTGFGPHPFRASRKSCSKVKSHKKVLYLGLGSRTAKEFFDALVIQNSYNTYSYPAFAGHTEYNIRFQEGK